MKKSALIIISIIFSSVSFAEMKIDSKEHKELCLGQKANSPQYQVIYDALNMLIKDKNCFISNIVVYPHDKKANKALAVYRPECKIKIGNTSPKVILKFEIDAAKKNQNESFYQKVVRKFQDPESKEIPTEFIFRRGQNENLKNANDYYYGNKDAGEKGFRELAVEAGACKADDQIPMDEPNQSNFAQSSSSQHKSK